MKNDTKTEAELWLSQAADDLKYARVLLREGGFALACFVSQQVAEKSLKGFLFLQGEELIKGHSIETLGKWCGRYSEEVAKAARKAQGLDLYYIPSRYPNGLPQGSGPPFKFFTQDQAAEAVRLASAVLRACRRKR